MPTKTGRKTAAEKRAEEALAQARQITDAQSEMYRDLLKRAGLTQEQAFAKFDTSSSVRVLLALQKDERRARWIAGKNEIMDESQEERLDYYAQVALLNGQDDVWSDIDEMFDETKVTWTYAQGVLNGAKRVLARRGIIERVEGNKYQVREGYVDPGNLEATAKPTPKAKANTTLPKADESTEPF